MASVKKQGLSESEIKALTPALNPDGTRPAVPTPAQAVLDADDAQMVTDALAGNIKLPGLNSASGVNPANPYAGEGRDPNWKPPVSKDLGEAVGDAFLETFPSVRTWGADEPAEKPKEGPAEGEPLVYADSGNEGYVAPRVIPAHEVPLVDPKRNAKEQEAFAHIQSGYVGQRVAIEGEKDAEDEIAKARAVANDAKAEGHRKVGDVADQARWNVESRALADKEEGSAFRKRMNDFSERLGDDKLEYKESVPKTVVWTIARALGSIQQGLMGLPTNQVADQIDNHIKQSLDMQKGNHAIRRERLGDMQKFYDLAASESKDQNERARLTYGYALEAAKAEADRLAALAGTPLAEAEASKIKAALSEKSAQVETQGEYGTELLAAQAENRNFKWVQAGVEGGSGKEKDGKHVYYDAFDKKYYAAESAKEKEELAKTVQVSLQIRDAAVRYQNALKKLGGVSGTFQKIGGKAEVDTADMSEARAAHIALLTDVRDANQEGGVIREGLKKAGIYEHSIISPDKLTGDATRQIDVIIKRTDSLRKFTRDTYAPTEVRKVGQPYGTAPKDVFTGQVNRPKPKSSQSAVGFTPAGAKAKGGNVKDEKPYLVGEEGPELVVPNKPGFVMTALQTAALKGAPPTSQQLSTLPSAMQRYAERMRLKGREDGGVVHPDEEARDAEETARFMGPSDGRERVHAPQTDDDFRWAYEKAAYEKREAEHEAKAAAEKAAEKAAERAAAEKRAMEDQERRESGPVQAWANRAARAKAEEIKKDPEKVRTLYRTADFLKSAAGGAERVLPKSTSFGSDEDIARWSSKIEPAWLKKTLRSRVPVREPLSFEREGPAREGPVREPVSFERARAKGGPIDDRPFALSEDDGQQLHQSEDGHAFLAEVSEAQKSSKGGGSDPGASLSGKVRDWGKFSRPPEPEPEPEPEPTKPPPPKKSPRGRTAEELMRAANAMEKDMRETHQARMDQGPAVYRGRPIEEGNIEHRGREIIQNADGSVSTVRSMSFNDGPGREVLIPTAYGGALHDEDESIENYRKTGDHMGVFRTPEDATATAIKVHNDYEQGKYDNRGWLDKYMAEEKRAYGGPMLAEVLSKKRR